ncbi:beta strand repeat-containing protein, partial [Thermodesulfobacteriota bacterium]
MADLGTTPLIVNTGISETETITLDFAGANGELLEASGHINIGVYGFFHVSGGFAFTRKTESVNLYDAATGILDTTPTQVNILTLGASNVNAFAGVNGPYWTDLDHSGTVTWTNEQGELLDEATADLNHDGIVDPNETAELSEAAVGLNLQNVNFALALMSPRPPPVVTQQDAQQAARVTMVSPGLNNDLTFTAAIAGAGFNQVTVEYVNSDHTDAVYNSVTKKLTISVIPGVTTAADIITLMKGVGEFNATGAEAGSNGLINTGSAITADGAEADGGNPAVAAHVTVVSPGLNNDLTFTSTTAGTDYNDVTVEYLNGSAAGVSYDNTAKKLTVTVIPGVTTAAEIIILMTGQSFTAAAAEGAATGVINTAPGSTAATGTGTAAAYAIVKSPGPDNDLIFVGNPAGIDLNQVTVEYVNGTQAGAVYNSTAKKLTVTVVPGFTTAGNVITLLESVPEFNAIAGEGGTDGAINTAPGSTGSTGTAQEKAQVTVVSPGPNNDLTFTATAAGTDLNDVTVEYVHGTLADAQYLISTKILKITIVPGVTTAAEVITLLDSVQEFTAAAVEAGNGGVIDTAEASTGTTGGTAQPPPPVDQRKWTSLKASVGSVGFVGIDGLTVRADNLMVAINQRSGQITGVPGPPLPGTSTPTLTDFLNTAMVDFESSPLDVKTGSGDNDFITFDFAGSNGNLLEAAGSVTIDVFGFFYVSGNFAFVKKTETIQLYDTQEGSSGESVEVDLLTVGASNVNAFAGVNGPYWVDMDGSGDISWVDENGVTQDQAMADLNHDGIVDPDETEELNEKAIGFALADVNFALAMMTAHKPIGPPPVYYPAYVTIVSPGSNNDITFTARKAGPYFNDVKFEYINGTELGDSYDSILRKCTITVIPGVTTAADIISHMDTNQYFIATAAEAGTDGVINTKAGSTLNTGTDSPPAHITIESPGPNNDVTFTATASGDQFNNVTVEYVNGLADGAVYDAAARKLTITVVPGITTAARIIEVLEASSIIEFTAAAAEAGDRGVINTKGGSTGKTGNGPGTLKNANVTVRSAGANNDLVFTAIKPGPEYNNVTVEYVSGASLGVVYDNADSMDKRLTITIIPGTTTAAQIIAALAGTPFTAAAAETGTGGIISINDPVSATTGITGNSVAAAEAAYATIKIDGDNNDLTFTATTPGIAFNSVSIVYEYGTEAGAAYYGPTKTLTVTVVENVTTAADVITLLESVPEFYAAAAEEGTDGKIIPATASTGYTGSDENFARVIIKSPGENNDLKFTAKSAGPEFNNVTIKYVNGAVPGALYNILTSTLTVTVVPGKTTAQDVINLMLTVSEFTAVSMEGDGTGVINTASTSTTLKAQALLSMNGANNDLLFVSKTPETQYGENSISLVIDNSISGNVETAYNETAKTLTVKVKDNTVTAAVVRDAVNAATGIPFTVKLDTTIDSLNNGIGTVTAVISTTSSVVVGVKAGVTMVSTGSNNDLIFTATNEGSAYNNVTVEYIEDTVEGAVYADDGTTKKLTITIIPGTTTAQDVINLMLTVSEFTAVSVEGDASGVISAASASTTLNAQALLTMNGANNDLLFAAKTPDFKYEENTISIVIDNSISVNVEAVYNETAKTLTVKVKNNTVTAAMIRDAVNADAGIPFAVRLDTTADSSNDGSGTVVAASSMTSTLKAHAEMVSPGSDNDLIFTAKTAGADLSNVLIQYVESTGVGPAAASYDSVTGKLTIPITPGVTTAAQVMLLMAAVPEFTVTPGEGPDEGGTGGIINTAAKTTGATGGVADLSGMVDDQRTWLSLKASVGLAEFVGVEGMTLRAEDLMVAINQSGGSALPVIGPPLPDPTPGAPPVNLNPTVADYEAIPLNVKTGPGEDDIVTLDFAGSNGELLEASGSVTIDMFGFFHVSGNFAFTKKTESVLLYDTVTKQAHNDETTVDVLTVGASNVNAFAGVNGPYWTDMDGSGDISWVDENGVPKVNDLDGDGIVDPDETAELSESAVGLSLENVNFALAMMSPKTLPEDYTPPNLPNANVTIISDGVDNDLKFTATTPGSTFNNVTVEYVEGDKAGAVYDSNAKKLTITFVSGFTKASDIISLIAVVPEFTATVAEGSGNGVISSVASASTATTGGTTSGIPKDNRKWIALKASVGGVEFVGIEGLTVRADDLMVAISQSTGQIDGAPIYYNTASVDFATTPITVKTSSNEADNVIFDYPGHIGNLLEASGRVTLNVFGFFHVSGNFAFVKKTEKIKLYDTVTGQLSNVETEVDLLTVGVSQVNAFAGVNGPYWADLDGDGDISWTDSYGLPLDPAEADLNHNGIVDADESAELSEAAVGLSLADVNFALAMMTPTPPAQAKATNLAHVTMTSPGPNNDITFTSKNAGPSFNNVTVEYVNGDSLGAAFDSAALKLSITVVPGVTTAADIITYMEASQFFVASAAEADTNGAINTKSGSTLSTGTDTVEAHVTIESPGPDNDLTFTATAKGDQFNNVTVEYVNGFAPAAVYTDDGTTRKLTITLVPGVTTAARIIQIMAATVTQFTASSAEADDGGVINTSAGSTGTTGDGLGVVNRANVSIKGPGDNKLKITANTAGPAFNDVTVEIVTGASLSVFYDNADSTAKKLTITIVSNETTAAQVITKLAGTPFTAASLLLDTSWKVEPGSGNTGTTGNPAAAAETAWATIKLDDDNNDLTFRAAAAGAAFNEVTISYVYGTEAGVVYDGAAKTLTITVVQDVTTAADVINLLQTLPEFTAIAAEAGTGGKITEAAGSTRWTGSDANVGRVTVKIPGENNDLRFVATTAGPVYNGVTVKYVHGAAPVALYNALTKTLTITVNSGVTTAAQVITLMETVPQFKAEAVEAGDSGVINTLRGSTGTTGVDAGTSAHVTIQSTGADNDLTFTATTPGPDFNNVIVEYVEGLVEGAIYTDDATGKKLTVTIVSGVTTAQKVMTLLAGTPFTAAVPTEDGTTGTGLIKTPSGSTGGTGGVASTAIIHGDKRSWISLKASVGQAEFVGIDNITVRAENLMVAINNGSGQIEPTSATGLPNPTAPPTPNTAVVAYDAKPLVVKTGSGDNDNITFDFAGSSGKLLEAAGHVTIDVLGFFQVSGGFAFTKKTETVKLANTITGVTESQTTKVDVLTIGASKVNAFVGVNGPYWVDLDGDNAQSWVLPDISDGRVVEFEGVQYGDINDDQIVDPGETADPNSKFWRLPDIPDGQVVQFEGQSYGDHNYDNIVDVDETAELSEEAVGFSLSDVNFALAAMTPSPLQTPPAPVSIPPTANVTVTSPGLNNDLVFTASEPGPDLNDVTVSYIHGSETSAVFDAGQKTLTITIIPGVTTGDEIISLMNGVPEFTASPAEGVASGVIDTAPGSTGSTGTAQEKANVTITSPGPNNDLTFIAQSIGEQYNNVTIEYVNGDETGAVYSSADPKTLTITVVPGVTTPAEIITALADINEFSAEATEGGTDGVINTAPRSTGKTGNGPEAAENAYVTISIPGTHNDLTFTATTPGIAFNNVTVEYVDSGGAEPSAAYTGVDPKKLTIQIKPGVTTAAEVITLLEGVSEFSATVAEGAASGVLSVASGSTLATGSEADFARVIVKSPGENNDLKFVATTQGPDFSNVTVRYVDSIAPEAFYNPLTRTLEINIKPGITTADDIITLMASVPEFAAFAAEGLTTGIINTVSSSTGTSGATAVAASVTITSPGENNDLTFKASETGTAFNNVTVEYANGAATAAVYNPVARKLLITVAPGITTAADIISVLEKVDEFSAVAAEGGTDGIINTASGSTGLTGGPVPVITTQTQVPTDKRSWLTLKAEVGRAEFIGVDGLTIQAENLLVAISQGSGQIIPVTAPTPGNQPPPVTAPLPNNTVVAYDATPLVVKTGPMPEDTITYVYGTEAGVVYDGAAKTL